MSVWEMMCTEIFFVLGYRSKGSLIPWNDPHVALGTQYLYLTTISVLLMFTYDHTIECTLELKFL